MRQIIAVTYNDVYITPETVNEYITEYEINKAKSYLQEAEYYHKKAESYSNEAVYYLEKAKKYQQEVEYYTKKNDADNIKTYTRYLNNAIASFKTQLQYAKQAEENAISYLKKAESQIK